MYMMVVIPFKWFIDTLHFLQLLFVLPFSILQDLKSLLCVFFPPDTWINLEYLNVSRNKLKELPVSMTHSFVFV